MARQAALYFGFAALAAGVNLLVQYLNEAWLAPWVCDRVSWPPVQRYYCPEDFRVLVGAFLGVGVGYLLKFLLDKFVVFQKRDASLKQTTREFAKYFGFAVFTTVVVNVGGQFLLYKAFGVNYLVAGALSLATGYVVKFFLDRRFVFA